MSEHDKAYLNELIHDAAYEAVRQSSLFQKCANEVVDAKAKELAGIVSHVIDSWIDKETGDTFPVLSAPLKSLRELESEREEMEYA